MLGSESSFPPPFQPHLLSSARPQCGNLSRTTKIQNVAMHKLGISINRSDRPVSEVSNHLVPTGKALSLHAGAHPTCASESLHPEAPGYRRELPFDGQHPTRAKGASFTTRSCSTTTSTWLVGICLSVELRMTDGYLQMWRIGTSTSLTPAPRPRRELSTNPTLLRPPRLLRWHNCTTIA